MHVRAVMLAAVVVLGSASTMAKPYTFEKQYKAAVKQENTGDITGALAAFEAIPDDKRDYNTKLHIASCKKKLGRLLDAEKDYEAIRTDPKADAPTVDTAASDLEDLRGRIPKIRVRLTTSTSGVVVTIDGAEVVPPIEHRTNPGEHHVVAKRGESVVYERRVNVPESASIEVEIDAPVAPVAAPPIVQPPIVPEAPHTSNGSRALPFYIAGGVLGAGAIVSFVLASSAKAGVTDNCATQHSLTCNVDDAGGSRVRTWETIGWVSGGLAVVSVGIGIAIHARRSEAPASSATVVRPTVGTMNGLMFEGSF